MANFDEETEPFLKTGLRNGIFGFKNVQICKQPEKIILINRQY